VLDHQCKIACMDLVRSARRQGMRIQPVATNCAFMELRRLIAFRAHRRLIDLALHLGRDCICMNCHKGNQSGVTATYCPDFCNLRRRAPSGQNKTSERVKERRLGAMLYSPLKVCVQSFTMSSRANPLSKVAVCNRDLRGRGCRSCRS